MVDSRQKGARAETVVKNELKKLTGLSWERTPGSGALDPKHLLKGDLYVPGRTNLYCVEVKHYKDDHFTSKILTDKNPQIFEWWDQCCRQADQMGRDPLLIFKHDRSKIFCAFENMPDPSLPCLFVSVNGNEFWVSTLENWISIENPKFVS